MSSNETENERPSEVKKDSEGRMLPKDDPAEWIKYAEDVLDTHRCAIASLANLAHDGDLDVKNERVLFKWLTENKLMIVEADKVPLAFLKSQVARLAAVFIRHGIVKRPDESMIDCAIRYIKEHENAEIDAAEPMPAD